MFHCPHILWCGHFSSRIAGSRLLKAWHLNTSYIILFTQITHMYFFSCIILTVSPMQIFHCCRYNHPHRCDLIDQFDIQPERINRGFDWWLYQALLRHTNNIIKKIGLHWHQRMHGDSDTFNVQGDDIIRSINLYYFQYIPSETVVQRY